MACWAFSMAKDLYFDGTLLCFAVTVLKLREIRANFNRTMNMVDFGGLGFLHRCAFLFPLPSNTVYEMIGEPPQLLGNYAFAIHSSNRVRK